MHPFSSTALTFLLFLSTMGVYSQTATAPSAGTGTSANPYQIASLNNLYWIYASTARWNDHYIQTAHIDAAATSTWNGGEGWLPIGNNTTKFTGSYNGNGFAIRNLYIARSSNSTTGRYQGLFGYIENAVLDTIRMESANITGYQYVGAIAGYSLNSTIDKCFTSGSVSAPTSSGRTHVGGWCGLYTHSSVQTISNGSNQADVTGYSYVGGIFGQVTSQTNFSHISNSGNVLASGSTTGSNWAGGIVGQDSYNGPSMQIVRHCSNAGTVSGARDVGGLFGDIKYADIRSCNASGNVTGTYGRVGGIAGEATDTYINYCSVTATTINSGTGSGDNYAGGWVGFHSYSDTIMLVNETVSANVTGYDEVGGFFGLSNANISFDNCSNSGNITASGSSTASNYVGGLIGNSSYAGPAMRNVHNCSNTGAISGGRYVGGLFGHVGYADIRNCSASGNVTGTYGRVGGIAGEATDTYINDCSVTATTITTGSGNNSWYAGGWVGFHTYSDTIKLVNESNAADVSAFNNSGGFFGISNANIAFENCSNSGNITSSGDLSNSYYAGGFIGNSSYAGPAMRNVRNCSNTGAISGAGYVGGLFGNISYADIRNCSASGNVTGTYGRVGGIAGEATNTYINDCSVGTITINTGSGSNSLYAGGWVGYHTYTDTIKLVNESNPANVSSYHSSGGFFGFSNANIAFENCSNSGNITASGSSTNSIHVGGLIGQSSYAGPSMRNVRNCSNTGAIAGARNVGGLFGSVAFADIRNCSASGNITGSNGYVGGVAGEATDTYINDCSVGTITINTGTGSNSLYAGGWVGFHTYTDTIVLVNESNTAAVSGYNHVGGFFGISNAPLHFYDCSNSGAITGSGSTTNSLYVGGLIGRLNYTTGAHRPTFKRCENTGNIAGASRVAGICGEVTDAYFEYCSNTGNITGSHIYVGGILGNTSSSDFYRCKSTGGSISAGTSSGDTHVGGIVGDGSTGTSLEECFSTSNVTGYRFVGGLAGHLTSASVINCYAQGNVTVSDDYAGGLVGEASGTGMVIRRSYSTGSLSRADTFIGGLVGNYSGSTTASYWDTQSSGESSSATGSGRTTAQMQTQSTFSGWNFLTVWHLDSCNQNGYPSLRWQNIDLSQASEPSGNGSGASPFLISNTNELYWLMIDRKRWAFDFEQTATIDASSIPVVCGHSATPIGDVETVFSGEYDGGFYEIQNLDLDVRGGAHSNVGLFGYSRGDLKNILLNNVSVSGASDVGGLVGEQYLGSIVSCGIMSGQVTGSLANTYTGGLAGRVGNVCQINRCFSRANVSSVNGSNLGSFVGRLEGGADIFDSYATGDVGFTGSAGTYAPGGFAGVLSGSFSTINRCYAVGAVTSGQGFLGGLISGSTNDCFFDLETTGQSSTAGTATACSTSVMKTTFNYTQANWDFQCEVGVGTNDYWGRNTTDNSGYPWLSWEGYTMLCPVWTGAVSEDWANASNWTPNEIPVPWATISFSNTASNDASLDQHREVGSLDFNGSNRHVLLNGSNLTALNLSNFGSSSFVKTDSLGVLIMPIADDSSMVFPMGKSSYNPLEIKNNTGSLDTFSLRVLDEVYRYGTTGEIHDDTPRIRRTWDIGKVAPNAGAGIDLTFYWNPGEQDSLISNWALFHNAEDGSGWQEVLTGNLTRIPEGLEYTGYTGSFSPFAIGDQNSPLPIQLADFRGVCTQDYKTFYWSTASEINNHYFSLQQSADMKFWEEIATLDGVGYSSTLTHYKKELPKSRAIGPFYRLVQYDFDGSFEAFSPIALDCSNPAESSILLYPNPNTSAFFVSGLQKDASWTVTDMSGKTHLQGVGTGETIKVYSESLAPGAYLFISGEKRTLFVKTN